MSSNDLSNTHSQRVQVIPATSATGELYPPECLVKIKNKRSKLMADQIMTVSKDRLYNHIGQITDHEMTDVERVILLQLGIAHF